MFGVVELGGAAGLFPEGAAVTSRTIVVLTGTTKWPHVRLHLERIAAVMDAVTPGSYTEIPIPFA